MTDKANVDDFICPECGFSLSKNAQELVCDNCNVTFEPEEGVYDFTLKDYEDEKDFYENYYDLEDHEAFSMEKARQFWEDELTPENQVLLESIKPLENKRCLLLGNGLSLNELYFLTFGAELVFTDLSNKGVIGIKKIFERDLKEFTRDDIEFYAVDALETPFPNDSFDVVYGHAFVHHIPDKEALLSECKRVLKPGGKTVFRDVAYSPVWETAKNTILKPLQMYSHWKTGISPQDKRATEEGGFERKEVKEWFKNANISLEENQLIWNRVNFFLHLWKRGNGKLIGWDSFRDFFAPFFKFLDSSLQGNSLYDRNQLRLIWGFMKKET